MDYAKLETKMASKVKKFGVPVTVTRLGEPVLKSYAIFTSTVAKDDTQSDYASLSKLTVTTSVAYIGGAFKNPPKPGDDVVGKLRSYIVTSVETYMPADVVIGYKLELE